MAEAMTGEIIPHTTQDLTRAREASSLIMPVISAQEMRESIARWNELKNAVLDDSDWQQAGTKRFIKKSGWEKLAVCFAVSTEVIHYEAHRDSEGNVTSAEVQARATAPNGRFADGVGSCDVQETRFRQDSARQKLHHDILATAETRARNRACSNLFGHGEQDAESMVNVNGSPGPSDGAYDTGGREQVTTAAPPVKAPHCPNDGRHIMQARQRKNDGKQGVAGSWYWKCTKKREDGEWCNGYRSWEDGNRVVEEQAKAEDSLGTILEGQRKLTYELLKELTPQRIADAMKAFAYGRETLQNKLADLDVDQLRLLRRHVQAMIASDREAPVQQDQESDLPWDEADD